ncbi:MAG: ribosome small subunit-dependent GTPase [Firmicutes bacterium]|nr:ribosome small subunit-dependent GTPase [Bacillota bacterium]
MIKTALYSVGLTARFAQEATLYDSLYLARVSRQNKSLYNVITENTEIPAEISGKMAYMAREMDDYPVVGDWVMLDRLSGQGGNAIIRQILSRTSLLSRKAAGDVPQLQPIAANIDTIFICMSLNQNFNLRRLERYLAVAWDSRANPVVVLTKSDLCEDLPSRIADVHSIALGVDVLVTSSTNLDGYSATLPYVSKGQTVAFVGSSGVGKSTLINCLAKEQNLATNELGENGKGRHTTTYRQLIVLPTGGVVIDTPGMRELQLERADIAKTFVDIEELARTCRFSDCTHQTEPGCAVRASIQQGSLPIGRLLSYQKLQNELSYQGLDSHHIEKKKIDKMFGGMSEMKQARREAKTKNKHR